MSQRPDPDRLYDVNAVAQFLHVHRKTVYEMINRGSLNAPVITGGSKGHRRIWGSQILSVIEHGHDGQHNEYE